jgi:hypothetical protein
MPAASGELARAVSAMDDGTDEQQQESEPSSGVFALEADHVLSEIRARTLVRRSMKRGLLGRGEHQQVRRRLPREWMLSRYRGNRSIR